MTTKTLSSVLLIAALAMMGCSNSSTTTTGDGPPKKAETGHDSGGHAHGVGPNGGVVFDLGKHHAEFTVDHGKQQCMVVVLGDDARELTPIAAQELTLTTKEAKTEDGTVVEPMTITLTPQDETDGKATTFIGTDPGLANVADFDGTILGMIDGKPSQGEFSESAGGHSHGHSHGEDDALVWEGSPKQHAGLEIKLGHHGKHLHAGEEVEPRFV